MKAVKGDVIEFDIDNEKYLAEVSMVDKKEYGVYYHYIGVLTPDLIPFDQVLRVFKQIKKE